MPSRTRSAHVDADASVRLLNAAAPAAAAAVATPAPATATVPSQNDVRHRDGATTTLFRSTLFRCLRHGDGAHDVHRFFAIQLAVCRSVWISQCVQPRAYRNPSAARRAALGRGALGRCRICETPWLQMRDQARGALTAPLQRRHACALQGIATVHVLAVVSSRCVLPCAVHRVTCRKFCASGARAVSLRGALC